MAMAISSAAGWAQSEPIDFDIVNKIRDQGFNHSQVMEYTGYLSDVIGPRLAATPAMRAANDWTLEKFNEFGLENAHLESFEFGPGWTRIKSTVLMTAPRMQQLQAMPISWLPGTDGAIRGDAILAELDSKQDFEKFDDGVLAGKVVLISAPRSRGDPPEKIIVRRDNENLQQIAEFEIPTGKDDPDDYGERQRFAAERYKFLQEQGAIAVVTRSDKDGALINAEGGIPKAGEIRELPGVAMTWEDYGRITRLLDRGLTVTLELDIAVAFHDEDTKIYNTIAEIPGRGRNPEIVIAGAHLDSWFMGDGAMDNAAGSAIVMEAARILMALEIKPERTIRFALWAAEEQGLLGSIHHVTTHFADKPAPGDETDMDGDVLLSRPGPVRKKADYERLSAMFNLDTGSGRIRGIWGEGNAAAKPIFERWFEPFHDVGAATVTLRPTGGTDHQPFDWVGLPGFTFMQDRLDYDTRVHHTQIDTMDHVNEADLKQASVVMASFLYHAAMREERIPRKPLLTE